MLQLFNNVYIRHESQYDSISPNILMFSSGVRHPLFQILGLSEEAEAPTQQLILDKFYKGSLEVFWTEMMAYPENSTLYITSDFKMMTEIMVQYWKSLFKNPTPEFLYRLHEFYVADSRFKSYVFHDSTSKRWKDVYKSHEFLKFEDFLQMYEKAPEIECIRKADKSKMRTGIEILLANGFYKPQSAYRQTLNEVVQKIAQELLVYDLDDLKAEILNGFYDIKKIVPSAHFEPEKLKDWENVIFAAPELRWIVDSKLEEGNVSYIRSVYGKDLFKNLFLRLGVSESDTLVRRMCCVLEEDYEGFLRESLNSGFGSWLTLDHMRKKSNQLLMGYVQDLIRRNNIEKLSQFEFS